MSDKQLFLNQNTVLRGLLTLDGAEVSESQLRMLVKTADDTFVYPGAIDDDGEWTVEIPPMKGRADDGANVEVSLEVITSSGQYFNARNDAYTVFTPKAQAEVKSVIATSALDGSVEVTSPRELLIDDIVSALNTKGIVAKRDALTQTDLVRGVISECVDRVGLTPDAALIKEVINKLSGN